MYKKKYKNSDVSMLGLGCMRLPKIKPDKDDIDYVKAQEIVDYALSHGINYVDTAHGYHGGQSQIFLGKALKKHDRSSFLLATKLPLWSVEKSEDAEKIFNLQLERLQTDYFDFYLFHAVNNGSFKKSVKLGIYDILAKKKQEGKIRNLGFSFHDSPDVLEEVCNTYKWDFAQIQLNYLDWEMQDAKRQYEILERHGIPCIVMEPVRGGALANPCDKANELFLNARPDKSVASWAIRYAASLPNVMTVLSGMSTIDQIIDNVKTMSNFEPLTKEDYMVVDKAIEAYKVKDVIPCTGCRYCMDCSFGVDIPIMFTLYNKYAIDKNLETFKKAYNDIDETERADKCEACGNCMKLCPQAIKIPEKMEMIRELYKKQK
jgi:predicted aldo/keto reductase-like oxidoreductase